MTTDRVATDRVTTDRVTTDRVTTDRAATDRGPSTPWEDETGSFGTWLRRQREGRGIELQQIAEESKISLANLRAFEENRFDVLPAPVFAKGFLRQYARYVGLDPEEAVNFYVSACRSAEGEEDAVEPQPEASSGSRFKLAALAVVLTLAVALLIWLLTHWSQEPSGGTSPPPAPTVSETAPESRAAEPGVGDRALEPQAADARAADARAADAPDADARAADGPGIDMPRSDVSRSDVSRSDVSRSDVSAGESPLRVTLDFSAECWVEAAVDGERQIAENKIQGESLLLEAASRIELTVGNIDAVQVEVNGHPFEFDDVSGTKVRTQRIDLETVAALIGPGDGRS